MSLRILLTRPLQESKQLARQLSELGLYSIVMPFYGFAKHAPDIDVAATLANGRGRKLIVFTSPRAVDFGLAHIPVALRPMLEYATVGDATRRQLEVVGLTVSWQPVNGYSSEDLLSLEGLQNDPGVAIIMCAPDGRDVLQSGLESMGWRSRKAFVYQRELAKPTSDKVQEIISAEGFLSVWTSTSALVGAEKHLPATAWSRILTSPALVISTRIKHHLLQRGATDIRIAGGPGNADLVQSIRRLVEDRHNLKH